MSEPTDGGDPDPGSDENPEIPPDAVLDELFATIEARKAELPEGSYTASLFTHEKGENAVLEKIGEETPMRRSNSASLICPSTYCCRRRSCRLLPASTELDEDPRPTESSDGESSPPNSHEPTLYAT